MSTTTELPTPVGPEAAMVISPVSVETICDINQDLLEPWTENDRLHGRTVLVSREGASFLEKFYTATGWIVTYDGAETMTFMTKKPRKKRVSKKNPA